MSYSIQTLKLYGTARERGRAHGEVLRDRIHEHFEQREQRMLAPTGLNLKAFTDLVLEQSGFLAAACQYTSDVVEEVAGIAEGAGMAFERVFVAQLLDEVGWFKVAKGLDYSALDESHCSMVGIPAHRPVLGQNVDMGGFAAGWGILLHHEPGSPEGLLTLTLPGVVGIYGLNASGLGLCLNAMSARMSTSLQGLGTIFIARGLLACRDRNQAEQLLRAVPHATGETYTVGDASGVDCWEAAPNDLRRCAGDVATHTNHPLCNSDIALTDEGIARLPAEVRERFRQGSRNSETRLATLRTEVLAQGSRPALDTVKAALSSHLGEPDPVCRHLLEPEAPMTNFCLVMELGSEPRLHLTDGPPCSHDFHEFTP